MDHRCILDKGDSIEVNFVVHSEFDIIPVLFYYRLLLAKVISFGTEGTGKGINNTQQSKQKLLHLHVQHG